MHIGTAIFRLLALLAVIGLVLGPLAPSATAMPAAQMDMSADMPCCPDEAPAKDCAGKLCPLLGVCMSIALQALLPGSAFALRDSDTAIVPGTNDIGLSGLASGPPPRPPKA
jgi:hypothetical protein